MNDKTTPQLTLNGLITKRRDRFDLRYTSDEDQQDLFCSDRGKVDGLHIKRVFHEWSFVTFIDSERDTKEVLLHGMRSTGFTMTSPVVHYNPDAGWVITRSGSFYVLQGSELERPFGNFRLLLISAIFNSWGIGEELGMPTITFAEK